MPGKIPWPKIKNMKNKLNLFPNYLFILFSICFSNIEGQAPLSLSIKLAKDTANSIFEQNYVNAIYVISEFDTVITYPALNRLEIKLSTSTWIPIGHELTINEYDYLNSTKGAKYFSLLDACAVDSSIVSQFNTKGKYIEIRLHLTAAVNGTADDFYSNIDTLYLPLPTTDDLNAFQYLINSEIDINNFSWLWGFENESIEQYKHLCNSFPNSILADLARYMLLLQDHNVIINDAYPPSSTEKLYVKSQYQLLKNSKSIYIRNRTDDFYEKYIKE
jgi:hypothetical protein